MRLGSRLAFDVGKARIGVARCDRAAIMAVPVQTLRRDRYDADLAQAADLVEAYEIIEVIVGLPKHLSGNASTSTKDSRQWARKLAELIYPVPVRLVDERLTTVSAQRALHECGVQAKDFRKVVDQAAAVVILEHALATERKTNQPAGELVSSSRKGQL